MIAVAVAMVAAFYFAVVRPAQIPKDAVLVIRLTGAIEEDVTGSPLDQIMRRGATSLDQLRYALESAAKTRMFARSWLRSRASAPASRPRTKSTA